MSEEWMEEELRLWVRGTIVPMGSSREGRIQDKSKRCGRI